MGTQNCAIPVSVQHEEAPIRTYCLGRMNIRFQVCTSECAQKNLSYSKASLLLLPLPIQGT